VKAEEHTHGVGAIITNLQALETVLRYFLLKLRNQTAEFPKVGDQAAKKTYLTRSLSLDKLIRNYNSNLTKEERKFAIDRDVTRVRNAFAHGRLLTTSELPGRLWNFKVTGCGKLRPRLKVRKTKSSTVSSCVDIRAYDNWKLEALRQLLPFLRSPH
jgi:hypothetical protein